MGAALDSARGASNRWNPLHTEFMGSNYDLNVMIAKLTTTARNFVENGCDPSRERAEVTRARPDAGCGLLGAAAY